jgi:hypothetical protein
MPLPARAVTSAAVDRGAALDAEVCSEGARIRRAGTPSGGSAGPGTAEVGSWSSATGLASTESDAPAAAVDPPAAADRVEEEFSAIPPQSRTTGMVAANRTRVCRTACTGR